MHRGQIHYPFVMFGMKTATKLDFYKNVSDKYFFAFVLHKSIKSTSVLFKTTKIKKKIQDFYSLIAKFISDVTDFGKKTHKITYFQYNFQSDCGLEFFLLLSQSWACPRLGKTLALMHF